MQGAAGRSTQERTLTFVAAASLQESQIYYVVVLLGQSTYGPGLGLLSQGGKWHCLKKDSSQVCTRAESAR